MCIDKSWYNSLVLKWKVCFTLYVYIYITFLHVLREIGAESESDESSEKEIQTQGEKNQMTFIIDALFLFQ